MDAELINSKSLSKKTHSLQNSKTPEERAVAKQALEDLFSMGRPAKHEISLNGRKEVASAMWRKYETIN